MALSAGDNRFDVISRARRLRPAALALLVAFAASGCVERTISISSSPSGALVFLNDEEVGRTPCEVSFLHYGTYDVRLLKDGYEPWIGPAEAKAPLYDLPGPDLISEILPAKIESHIDWHFDLSPVRTDVGSITDRAEQLRARLQQEDAASQQQPPAESRKEN